RVVRGRRLRRRGPRDARAQRRHRVLGRLRLGRPAAAGTLRRHGPGRPRAATGGGAGMTALHKYGPGALAFLGFWVLLLAGGRSNFFRDPGTFWHTRVGERILTDGFFDADPYTFTFAGQKWIPHQWLGEVTMAVVHRAGGLDALLVAACGVLAALFAWLTVRFLRTGLHPVAVALFVGLAL